MTEWWAFVDSYMQRRKVSGARLAQLAGYDKSQVTKWSQGAHIGVKSARATALALRAPVLEAFVAAGFLNPEDTAAKVIERPLAELADDELLAEIRRRMIGDRVADGAPGSGALPEGGRDHKDRTRLQLVDNDDTGPDEDELNTAARIETDPEDPKRQLFNPSHD